MEALKKYASEQRLTGIIVMDENGKVEEECSSDGLNSESLKNIYKKLQCLTLQNIRKRLIRHILILLTVRMST